MTRRQPVQRTTVIPGPGRVVPPGIRLRTEIGTALLELREMRADAWEAMRAIEDNLHGALAHTAAVGETCQVKAAVEAVRTAARHLRARSPREAYAALTDALGSLPDPLGSGVTTRS